MPVPRPCVVLLSALLAFGAVGCVGHNEGATAGGTTPGLVTARYVCADGSAFVAMFDNKRDVAVLARDGVPFARLAGQRPASGIWYEGEGYALRGKGNEAQLTRDDGSRRACTADAHQR